MMSCGTKYSGNTCTMLAYPQTSEDTLTEVQIAFKTQNFKHILMDFENAYVFLLKKKNKKKTK